MKIWSKDEEILLIEEIQILKNITLIAEQHKRSVGGIKARIKKIIDSKQENSKLTNLNEIIKTYFSNEQEKEEYFKKLIFNIKKNIYTTNSIEEIANLNIITEVQAKKILINIQNNDNDNLIKERIKNILNKTNFDEDELIIDINSFNSIEEIIQKYSNIKSSKIIMILKKYLKKDISSSKKNKILLLLKKDDEYTNTYDDDTFKIDNCAIINAIYECKEDINDLKGDIKDIKNRLNLILEKLNNEFLLKKNKSKNLIEVIKNT